MNLLILFIYGFVLGSGDKAWSLKFFIPVYLGTKYKLIGVLHDPAVLAPLEMPPNTRCVGGCVSPRAGLDVLVGGGGHSHRKHPVKFTNRRLHVPQRSMKVTSRVRVDPLRSFSYSQLMQHFCFT
jgi:hypothetical protein